MFSIPSMLYNKIELRNEKDIYKAIQYLPWLAESDRPLLCRRIENTVYALDIQCIVVHEDNMFLDYLKKPSITITDTLEYSMKRHPLCKFFVTNSYNDFNANNIDNIEKYIDTLVFSKFHAEYDNICKPIRNIFKKRPLTCIYNTESTISTIQQITKMGNNSGSVSLIFMDIFLKYCNKILINLFSDTNHRYGKNAKIINIYLINIFKNGRCYNPHCFMNMVAEFVDATEIIPQDLKLIIESLKIYYKCMEIFVPDDDLNYLNTISSQCSDKFFVEILFQNRESNILNRLFNINNDEVLNYLETMKHDIEHDLNLSISNNSLLSKIYFNKPSSIVRTTTDIVNYELYYIKDNINNYMDELYNFMNFHSLNFLENKITMYLLKEYDIINDFIQLDSNKNMYIGIKNNSLYLMLTNNMKNEKIYMISLYNESRTSILYRALAEKKMNIICRTIVFNNKVKPVDYMANDFLLLENSTKITLDNGSNLKLKLTHKKKDTYMNRYNTIHTSLINNFRNNAYEAMKTDLSRLYLLIYEIERDVTYSNKPISVTIKSDANKARMFAKNDFKRYMKEISKIDRKFDIYKYISENKLDKDFSNQYDININMKALKKLITSLV